MYKYVKDYIPIGIRRANILANMAFITIHNTGNPESTARNEKDWLTNSANKRDASFHIVIDEREAIECIPLNEVAYHSENTKGNNTSISIEICESGNYKQNEENAIDLVAKMLVERSWGIDRLKRHYDWNGKNCPRIIMPYWDDFKKRIQNEIKKLRGEGMNPVLKLGDKGEYVKELQNALIKLGYNLGTYGADGDFGSATDTAVKVFQKNNGLVVDGIVGQASWEKLDELLKPKTSLPADDKYKNILIMIRNSINEVLGE